MTQRRMTYEGLAQAIADEVNETIRNEDILKAETVEQMIMDKASEATPDYLDHYDVASQALEMVEYA